MLSRQVGTSLLRLPIHSRLTLRTLPFQCQLDVASRAVLISSQRFYATPGRPRKAVGEPSKPVKRSAKRQATAPKTTGEAKKHIQAKKKAAAAKKPVKRPSKKKELTPAQKEVAKAKVTRAKTADLKKAALSPPKRNGGNAYTVFVKERLRGQSGTPDSAREGVRSAAREWKSTTPAEREVCSPSYSSLP